MIKGGGFHGVAVLLLVLYSGTQAEAGVAINIEEHRDSVAPFIERGSANLGKGAVARAVFARQIVNREPMDEVAVVSGDIHGVYFFTELKNMTGHTATHRWEYEGQRIGYTEFKVTASPWRAWSYRNIPPGSTGTWKVKVLNTVGEVIGEKTLGP